MSLFVLGIFDTVASIVGDYVDSYVDLAADFIKGQVWYIQVGIVLVGGIIVILGTIRLITKLTKILIVIAILAGLFFIYRNMT